LVGRLTPGESIQDTAGVAFLIKPMCSTLLFEDAMLKRNWLCFSRGHSVSLYQCSWERLWVAGWDVAQ